MKKIILLLIFLITLSAFAQNTVVIEKVAKKGYIGYMGRTTANVLYDAQVITVVLCEDHLNSGKKYGIVMIQFDRNTLEFVSATRPFGKGYVNAGKFDCRPIVMNTGSYYGMFFIVDDDGNNKVYSQEINVKGELIDGPKEMFTTKGKELGKKQIDNLQFLEIFPTSRRINCYYKLEQSGQLVVFEDDLMDELIQKEAAEFFGDTSKRYNSSNSFPASGINLDYMVDSSIVKNEKLVLDYSFDHIPFSHTSYVSGAPINAVVHIYDAKEFTLRIPGKWKTQIIRNYYAEEGNYIPTILRSNNNLYVFYYNGSNNLTEESKLCCSKIDWENGNVTEMKVAYPDGFKAAFSSINAIPLVDGSFAVLALKGNGLTPYKLTFK